MNDVDAAGAQGQRPPGARGRRAGGLRHQRAAAPADRVDRPAGRLSAASRQAADQSGALASLAGNGAGPGRSVGRRARLPRAGLWQVADAVVGHPGDDKDAWGGGPRRSARPSVYLVLAWSRSGSRAASIEQQPQQSVDFTASLLDKPGGRVLVVLIGLVIIGVGGYHVYKGATKRFLRDLEENPGTWATRAGRVGYIAKGVALAIVGLLFVAAGVHKQAKEASGLDGALPRCATQPLRPGAAHPGGGRLRGLRPLQLRPRPARQGLTRSARPGPTRAGTARPGIPQAARRRAERTPLRPSAGAMLLWRRAAPAARRWVGRSRRRPR